MGYLSIPPHYFFRSLRIPLGFLVLIVLLINAPVNKSNKEVSAKVVEETTLSEPMEIKTPPNEDTLVEIEVAESVSTTSLVAEGTLIKNEPEPEVTATETTTKEPELIEIKTNATKPTPTPATVPVIDDLVFDINEMLKTHNAVRREKGLNDLTWSIDLAKEAQEWSEVLRDEKCVMRHDLESPYGENIFWQQQTGGDTNGFVSTPSDAVFWWAAEEKYYNYNKNTCDKGEQCGHYTQIVWADTTEVGCGVSYCQGKDKRTDIWVCRYNPPGNIIGTRPY